MNRTLALMLLLASLAAISGASSVAAQDTPPLDPAVPVGSAFTYQGRLETSDVPVDGTCDFMFILYASLAGSDPVGPILMRTNVPVKDGYFTANLDFGASAFPGEARWLAVGVRCPAGAGSYIMLSPRQKLSGAPVALSLALPFRAQASLDDPLASFKNDGAGPAASFSSAAGDGLDITAAGRDGIFVSQVGTPSEVKPRSASKNGFEVAGVQGNGLNVGRADNEGVYVGSAGDAGVFIGSAASSGVYVSSAGYFGVFVLSAQQGVTVFQAGSPNAYNESGMKNGFQIGGAEGNGLYVGRADHNGVYVESADNGIYVNSADRFAGVFRGDIEVYGTCYGCSPAVFGINAGNQPLEPGQVVTIQGLQAETLDDARQVWRVVPVGEGLAAVGVVAGRAALEATPADPQDRPGESGKILVPGEGAAQPGEYLSIVIYGPVQVQSSQLDGAIRPGMRLAVGAAGRVRALKTVAVQGVTVAESAPVLGIALSAPDAQGMVWVLVDPQ